MLELLFVQGLNIQLCETNWWSHWNVVLCDHQWEIHELFPVGSVIIGLQIRDTEPLWPCIWEVTTSSERFQHCHYNWMIAYLPASMVKVRGQEVFGLRLISLIGVKSVLFAVKVSDVYSPADTQMSVYIHVSHSGPGAAHSHSLY